MKYAILLALTLSIFLVACTPVEETDQISFDEGIVQIQEYHTTADTSFASVPSTEDRLNALLAQLIGYKTTHDIDEPLSLLLDARIAMLDAKKKFDEGAAFGRKGTTEFGFGCGDMKETVPASATFRNESATLGFEALDMMQTFIDTYPDQAKSLNLTQRDVLALKAAYFEIQERAERDLKTIRSFCKDK